MGLHSLFYLSSMASSGVDFYPTFSQSGWLYGRLPDGLLCGIVHGYFAASFRRLRLLRFYGGFRRRARLLQAIRDTACCLVIPRIVWGYLSFGPRRLLRRQRARPSSTGGVRVLCYRPAALACWQPPRGACVQRDYRRR